MFDNNPYFLILCGHKLSNWSQIVVTLMMVINTKSTTLKWRKTGPPFLPPFLAFLSVCLSCTLERRPDRIGRSRRDGIVSGVERAFYLTAADGLLVADRALES